MHHLARITSPLACAVLGATLLPLPATAVSNEQLLQELKRLAARVEQLEAANRKLEAALQQAPAMADATGRIARVEQAVATMQQQPASKLASALQGVSATGSLLLVAQRAARGTTNGQKERQLNYRADADVTLPGGKLGSAEGKFYAHFRAGQGNGLANLNPSLTGGVNATALQLTNGDDSAAILAQAWYQLDVPLSSAAAPASRLEITVGKMDPTNFFDQNALAHDESGSFLNSVFVHNPLLDSGGDAGVDTYGFTPGLRLGYYTDAATANHWGLSLGVFGSGNGASFDTSLTDPYVIGQAEYHGPVLGARPGSYRLYAWRNGRSTPFNNASDGAREKHTGWGLSLDQPVAEHLGLFARYGKSTAGQVIFHRAFTLGGQLAGGRWGRPDDRFGFAQGWLRPSAAFKTAAPALDADADGNLDFDFTPGGAERQTELFYRWQINEHLALSPDAQWVRRPGGDAATRSITVWGLRLKAAF